MKRWVGVFSLLMVFGLITVQGWAQTPEEKKIEALAATVRFKVLDTKHQVDFDVLGKEKGFNRRLSRVTAQLINIDVPEDHATVNPAGLTFLKKNAAEIDLKVKHRTTALNGYFGTGDWSSAAVDKFLKAYKANKNTTFKGRVQVKMIVSPSEGAVIDEVRLTSVDPENQGGNE